MTSTTLAWLSWLAIGYGPVACLLVLAFRYTRQPDSNVWEDLDDADTLIGWIAPGLAMLSGIALVKAGLNPIALALLAASSLAAVASMRYAAYLLRFRNKTEKISFRLRTYLRCLGPAAGVAVYLAIEALTSGQEFVPEISVRSYVFTMIAMWIGTAVFSIGASHSDQFPGRWRRLAPCELYQCIAEIAERIGVKVSDVCVATEMPFIWAGGLAYSSSSFALTSDLVEKLSKREADATIAHEIGHLSHKGYWSLHQPMWWVAALGWVAVGLAIEAGIDALLPGLTYPRVLLWLALFIVPQLAGMWYSRRLEHHAHDWLRVLEDHQAAIRGYYKLIVIDEIAVDRPWWSRILSTHPCPRQKIDQMAQEWGIDSDEVARLMREAEEQLESGPTDRYELVFDEEPVGEASQRPDNRKEGDISGLAVVLTVAALAATLALAVVFEDSLGFGIGALGFGLPIMGALVLAFRLASKRRVRRWHGFKELMRELLSERYPGHEGQEMLLLDAVDMAGWDEQRWQCALVLAKDGCLSVLGELTATRIEAEKVTGVSRVSSDGSNSVAWVVISYAVGGASRWIVLRTLGAPDAGEPRNLKALEKRLKAMIVEIGGTLPEREKLHSRMRACARRIPLALGLTALIVALCYLIDSRLDLGIGWIAYVWIPGSAILPLWAWVAAADADKPDLKRYEDGKPEDKE